MRDEGREQAKTVGVRSSEEFTPGVEGSRSDTPDVGQALTRQMQAGELAAARSTLVLPAAVAAALARLRHAQNEYEQARARDLRRSVLSPGAVLLPLFDAVLRARLESRRIGVTPDGTRTHA
jgi:hypothetical protein